MRTKKKKIPVFFFSQIGKQKQSTVCQSERRKKRISHFILVAFFILFAYSPVKGPVLPLACR